MSDFPHVFGTAMQLPKLVLELGAALGRHGEDPAAAAFDLAAVEEWVDAEPEVRACVLLSAAFMAGAGEAPEVPEAMLPAVAEYVGEFHRYAAAYAPDRAEAFHGRHFPAMPLPGQAGALASSLGFDRDDLDISLGVALVLLAAGRRASE